MREAPGASAATRERVLAVADELGYRPDTRARLLRSSRSRLLGVVFGVQHAFHGDLVGGLYAAADRVGLRAGAERGDPRPRRASAPWRSLLQDRCEALILLGPQAPTAYLADLAARLPVVVVARAVRHRAVDVVRTDDAAGLEQAVDHLVGLGHRRIAHIDGGRAPARPSAAAATATRMRRHGLEERRADRARRAHRGRRRRGRPRPARAAGPAPDRRHRVQRPLRHRRARRPARRRA